MRIDLEVLNSFDLIMTTSMMQSVDVSVSVSVCKQSMPRSCIRRERRENKKESIRNLGLEFL